MIQQYHCHVYIQKNWKQNLEEIFVPSSHKQEVATQVSLEEWMNKQNVTSTYSGILFSL